MGTLHSGTERSETGLGTGAQLIYSPRHIHKVKSRIHPYAVHSKDQGCAQPAL